MRRLRLVEGEVAGLSCVGGMLVVAEVMDWPVREVVGPRMMSPTLSRATTGSR